MRSVSWLHVSDIHMRTNDGWAQSIVRRAMCNDLRINRTDRQLDFVVVTGDLAFSGKAEEYSLVAHALDELSEATGVATDKIFCIPGNHDVDRGRQQFCFRGARTVLQDSNSTDRFLGAPKADDFRTLLARLENYRSFQESYFKSQERTITEDELGYVARVNIDGVRLAIVGLNTAWLANGGIEDHLNLLLGERQISNALSLATEGVELPHIVVAIGHHPLHLLQDFDRRAAMRHIYDRCHFYHCGHLHEPEERSSGQTARGCLTVTSGSWFERRDSHNAYSLVRLDLLKAVRVVETHRYSPGSGSFGSVSTLTYRMEVQASAECNVTELAEAFSKFGLPVCSYYLASLILELKSDVPVGTGSSYTMVSVAAFEKIADEDLKQKTLDFLTFRNVLRVLYGREDLASILAKHGDCVMAYSTKLSLLRDGIASLRETLDRLEQDARSLSAAGPGDKFSYTRDLWQDLAAANDWKLLREQVEPHVSSPTPSLALQAKRMLALALASSAGPGEIQRAAEIYHELLQADRLDATDAVSFARLLLGMNRADDAKQSILDAIRRCPLSALDRLRGVGHEIVSATGDRTFRNQLLGALAERDGSHER